MRTAFEEEILSMDHDINLNIHYSEPEEVWEKNWRTGRWLRL